MKKTFIYIDNYRGFCDSLIEIRQVNYLVGENSTGKSSFLYLLEVFGSVTFWVFSPTFSIDNGSQKHFLDLVSASCKTKKNFTVGVFEYDDEASALTFAALITYESVEGRPEPSRASILTDENFNSISIKYSKDQSKSESYKLRKQSRSKLNFTQSAEPSIRQLVELHLLSAEMKELDLNDDERRRPIFFAFREELFDGKNHDERLMPPEILLRSCVELAPIRTKPRRTYDEPQTRFSPTGEHTPYIIRKGLANAKHAHEFNKYLSEAGDSSALFNSIKIRKYGRGVQDPFEMRIVLGEAELGLENVGYGVSQALPVLVEVFIRPKKTTYLIQQPEVHLHPKAQATVGDIIAEMARTEEKYFFIETHSDFTIDRFRLNIRRKGGIDSQLLFFERHQNTNKVTSIAIDINGDLDSNQPDAYREFFYNESLALLG